MHTWFMAIELIGIIAKEALNLIKEKDETGHAIEVLLNRINSNSPNDEKLELKDLEGYLKNKLDEIESRLPND